MSDLGQSKTPLQDAVNDLDKAPLNELSVEAGISEHDKRISGQFSVGNEDKSLSIGAGKSKQLGWFGVLKARLGWK